MESWILLLFSWTTGLLLLFSWSTGLLLLFSWSTGLLLLFSWSTGLLLLFPWISGVVLLLSSGPSEKLVLWSKVDEFLLFSWPCRVIVECVSIAVVKSEVDEIVGFSVRSTSTICLLIPVLTNPRN